jgi:tRNA pseudouridine38-40 synthase
MIKGSNELITITLTGNSFLYRMVRNMVATLVAVGHGKISPSEIPLLMEKRNRSLLPSTAPARGLFLMNVTFNRENLLSQGESASD